MLEKLLTKIEYFLTNTVFDAIVKIAIAALIVWLGFMLVKFIIKRIKKSKFIEKSDPSIASFLLSFTSIALKIIIVITAASVLGIPLTAFVTALGSAGIAIGLALQGSLSNLAGGIMILIFKPFSVGDTIEVNSEVGTVESISIFYTALVTADNRRITIPNGVLSNSSTINRSVLSKSRVDFEFSASYSQDTDEVIETIQEVAEAHDLVLNDPAPPFVRVMRQDASAVIYVLRVWTKNEDYWTVKFDIEKAMLNKFKEKNIEIPFPQLDVHSIK